MKNVIILATAAIFALSPTVSKGRIQGGSAPSEVSVKYFFGGDVAAISGNAVLEAVSSVSYQQPDGKEEVKNRIAEIEKSIKEIDNEINSLKIEMERLDRREHRKYRRECERSHMHLERSKKELEKELSTNEELLKRYQEITEDMQ